MRRGFATLLAVWAFGFGLATTASAAWRPLGLSGRDVHKLRSIGGDLYACTDDGLYRLSAGAPDTTWAQIGFTGRRVFDILSLAPGALLASRGLTGATNDTISLFRSVDAAVTWQPFQNGFGSGGATFARQARFMLGPHAAGEPLFAVGSRIEKSSDGGMSWRVVSELSCGLNALERSPANASVLWAGGETVIFSPCVLRSTDLGETWKLQSLFAGGDNAVDAIAGHPLNADYAYVGMEGWVQKTEDGGAHWTPLTSPDPSMYTFGMAVRPFGALKLYAAGARFMPDPRGVVFHQSEDGGLSWQAIAYPAAAGYGVNHLLLRTGSIEETLYVATGNGVYRHTQGVVDVPIEPAPASLSLAVRPNPSDGPVTIEFALPQAARATVKVFDIRGRMVAEPAARFYPPGVHAVPWNPAGLPGGLYLIGLRIGERTSWRKITLVR
ncbi:MAG TPA: hypothetical protein VFQ05_02655 [Candidatus Eisenbacteria bacterium]|nr:hypothetical protein [Candidatus Eisenbacteria bacterium]